MEFYVPIKRETCGIKGKWMQLDDIILGKISQGREIKYWVVSVHMINNMLSIYTILCVIHTHTQRAN